MATNTVLTELMTGDSNGKHETFHNWIYLCLHTKQENRVTYNEAHSLVEIVQKLS